MVRIKRNTVKFAGIIALFCLSLACFTYINSIPFSSDTQQPEATYIEEVVPETPEVLPDVELVRRLVRKAFEFMTLTNL